MDFSYSICNGDITMKRFLLSLVLATVPLFCSTAFAITDPADIVRDTTQEVLNRVASDRDNLEANPDELFKLVDEVILPNFDFERMSRWVLGKHWRGATAEQQQRFVHEFKTLLVKTYAKALFNYSGEELVVQPVTAKDGAKTVTVKTELVRPGANSSIPINYKMHVRDGRWKVFDVAVDGVSLVSTYRSSFAAEVRRSGIAGLIDTLLSKNQGS